MILRHNNTRLAACAVAAALMLFLFLLLLRGCAGDGAGTEHPIIAVPHTVVTDFGPGKDSQEEFLSELNRQSEASRVTLSINTKPVFASGDSKGNLWLRNDAGNHDTQIVEIVRNDTGDLIYTSDPIPAGRYINADTLDVALGSGVYPCTAHFETVDETSGQTVSVGSIRIKIHVIS